jgi:hypothetical protein
MPELTAAIDAFVPEHRRCCELGGGVEGGRVWTVCDCGAELPHTLKSGGAAVSPTLGERLGPR